MTKHVDRREQRQRALAIRDWARRQGMPVVDRGSLPRLVLEGYDQWLTEGSPADPEPSRQSPQPSRHTPATPASSIRPLPVDQVPSGRTVVIQIDGRRVVFTEDFRDLDELRTLLHEWIVRGTGTPDERSRTLGLLTESILASAPESNRQSCASVAGQN